MIEELNAKKPKVTFTAIKPRRERREESRKLVNKDKKMPATQP